MTSTPPGFHRDSAITLFNDLKPTPLFQTMEQTVEASPWHREANVLVHTQMVVDEYVRMTDELNREWTRADFLGAVSTIFHDTGKPAAKIEKYREDRGNYFAFHGHEVISSRLFETFACEHPTMFSAVEIFKVCWMIEHHMPWSIEDNEKRRRLVLTAQFIGVDVYTRALLADQYGRIADDKETKDANAQDWVEAFTDLSDVTTPLEVADDAPNLYVPIASSGSGKTTNMNGLRVLHPDLNVFSLDELRHEFYNDGRTHDGYRDAYAKSVADPTFESRASSIFTHMVREKKTMVVDNTNLGAKRRGNYITQARRLGYRVIAITMPVGLQMVLDRQHVRPDKNVPDYAVINQYNTLQQPSLGEFDEIVVSDHNLKLDLKGV